MKIEGSDRVYVPTDHLKAVQEKIQELKRKAGAEELGDRMSLQTRRPSGIGSGTLAGRAPGEHSGELSFEEMRHNLEQIKRTGQHAQLGDVHADLNMDRVRELLRPLG
ncbi:hypothetical protein [Desulfonatronum thioautotrophicum]|uniref:hypothetical protein n=1 Tax=Desulfonatronum thioautotrophicum TaxID=617001 RepID=UPI0005EB3047|nr:hypothetical protein [Desulfonatronum thioautotrophicum]